jgi:cation diffusion facilitator family transporter
VAARVQSEKVSAARLSILSNLFLTLFKLAAGLASGSVSVISEAAHSANDLLAAWVAFVSVRVADVPPDERHPYGHGKAESVSAVIEAGLLFLAAGWILWEAVHRLVAKESPQRFDLGVAMMAISVVVNWGVSSHLRSVAERTESLALAADAEHLRTDIATSVGVLVGLVLGWMTGSHLFDPLAAMVVAVLILSAAQRMFREAFHPLMDTSLPEEEVEVVRSALAEHSGVLGYHKLRTRKSGSVRIIDAHILVEDTLTLLAAHDLTEEIEDRIRSLLPNCEITLHTEPFLEETRHQFEQHGGPDPSEVILRRPSGPKPDRP